MSANETATAPDSRTAPGPANFLESVQGRTLYDPQRQAVEKNAHAVLGETTGSTGAANAPLSGTPITWVEGNGCHE